MCCLLSGQIQNTTSSPHDLGAPAWPAALQPYGHGDMNFSLSTVNSLLHQSGRAGPSSSSFGITISCWSSDYRCSHATCTPCCAPAASHAARDSTQG